MPPCPNCKDNIESLTKVYRVEHENKVTYNPTTEDLDSGPLDEQTTSEFFGKPIGKTSYKCPKCNAKLFTNADKAVEFLKQPTN